VSTHRTLPSEVEPQGLDDLISDCAALTGGLITLSAAERRVIRVPEPRQPLVIGDRVAAMVDGFGDYGSC
jgi:hypothetical protein